MTLRKVTLAFNKPLVDDVDAVFNLMVENETMLDWNGRPVSGKVNGLNVYDFVYEVPDQVKSIPIVIMAIGVNGAAHVRMELKLFTFDRHTIIPVRAPIEINYGGVEDGVL